MSKERLEEIKGRYMEFEYDFNLRKEDIEWLIEQAGRVQELEEELYGNDIQMGYKRMYGSCNRDYAKLLQQNKRYKRALEEISNADWNSEGLDAERELDKVTDVAFKALEGEE